MGHRACRAQAGTITTTGEAMSNIQEPIGPGADERVPQEPAPAPIPWAVQRIRRQLYWQAAFAFLRASFGLLVILLVVQTLASPAPVIAAIVFAAGSIVAVASFTLARQVKSQRRTTRTVIVGLEAALAVVYGVLAVQAIAGFLVGGGLAAVALNAVGLFIAASMLRHALGSEAKSWFSVS